MLHFFPWNWELKNGRELGERVSSGSPWQASLFPVFDPLDKFKHFQILQQQPPQAQFQQQVMSGGTMMSNLQSNPQQQQQQQQQMGQQQGVNDPLRNMLGQ